MGDTQEVGSIGVGLSFDAAGFKTEIANINRQLKVTQAEFQASSVKLGQLGSSTDKAKLQSESLAKQLELQRQKVVALTTAYTNSVEKNGAAAKSTQDLQTQLLKAQTREYELANQLDKTNKNLAQQSSALNKIATSLGPIGEKLSGFGKSMASVGQSLSMYVTAPLLGIGAASTKMAMDAVESENLFEVSMGGMAASTRKWSEEVSKSLGLNAFALRKNTGTFNAMLTSMGMGEQAAAGMSQSFSVLAYDMASFYDLKPEIAFEKLRAGISGELEPLKQLGIVVSETAVKTYAYTNGIAKQGSELTEQQKILARYGVIMESTKKAQGDLARTADSPTNKLMIMTEQVNELAIKFGNILIPIMQKVMKAIEPLIDWFNSLSESQKEFVVKMALISAVVGPSIGIIGKLTEGVGGLITTFSKVSKSISAAGGLFTVLTNPIGLVVVAVATLVGGLIYLYNTNETARYYILKAWYGIVSGVLAYGNFMLSAMEKIWGWIPGLGEKLAAAKEKVGGMLAEYVSKYAATTKEGVANEMKLQQSQKASLMVVKETGDAKVMAADRSAGAIKKEAEAARKAADSIKSSSKAQKEAAKETSDAWDRAGDRIKQQFSQMQDKALEAFKAMQKAQRETVESIYDESIAKMEGQIKAIDDQGMAEDEARKVAEREQRINETKDKIAQAQRDGDLQAVKDYERDLKGIYDEAERERREKEREVDKQKIENRIKQLETLKATELKSLEARQAQEEKAFKDKQEKQKLQFEQELKIILEQNTKRHLTYDQGLKQINGLLAKWGGQMYSSGATAGQSFADGIASKADEVKAAAIKLANAASKPLKLHSPADEGPLSSLDTWWTPFADTLLKGFKFDSIKSALNEVASLPSSRLNGQLALTNGFASGRTGTAGVGRTVVINSKVVVSGNYLANSVDEDRLADKVSQRIGAEFLRSIGGSF